MRFLLVPKVATLAALVAGCSGQPAAVTDRYVAFDPALVATTQAKVKVLDDFRTTLEAKDFAAIDAAYKKGFQAELKALVAAHAYVSDGAQLGANLDKQVIDAIAMGAGSPDVKIKEAAEELVQTIVYRFTFETIHGEQQRSTREGWDRAFAFYGRSADGLTVSGIAAKAQKRDAEFATKKNDTVFRALIEGRNALAAGDAGTTAAQAATVDKALTEFFGLQARHEFGEAAEAVEKNLPDEAVEPYAVGKGVIALLRDWIKTQPGGAATLATIDAELAKGDPQKPATMKDVKFTILVTAIDTTFGFKF